MTELIIVVLVIVVLGAIASVQMSTCWSRHEEREDRRRLKACPKCGKPPHLDYCCGEYFIHGDDPDCPYCGTAFTEMHSDPRMEIDAWNRRVEDVYSSLYKEVQSAIRNPEMYQGKTRKE